MTLPVYELIPEWHLWLAIAALFGGGVVSFIRTVDLEMQGKLNEGGE